MNDIRRVTGEIASGDPDAFTIFYRAKFDLVYHVARRTTSLDENSCMDIVQDSMMRVIRYIRPFDDDASLNRWLTCVTRSVACDHLRRERRRRRWESEAAECRPEVADGDVNEIQERLDWVKRELRGLDRAAAEIVELRYRVGLTLDAIGKRLGLTAGAVHGRLTRVIVKLRRRTSELRDD